jgi:Uma2 family endonuclease
MASKTLVPVEEYLKMSFDGPEPEYLDGEILERHLGSKPHSKVQKRLILSFEALRESCSLEVYPEITLRISPTRYRVADLAVFVGDDTGGDKYPTRPPEIVVEIVSENDRRVDIQEKLAEYHAWGIKHIWLVDPWTRKLSVYDANGLREVTSFDLPEFGAKLSTAEIFA